MSVKAAQSGSSLTYIANGIFLPANNSSTSLSLRLPPTLVELQKAAVSEKSDVGTLDECVVAACFDNEACSDDSPALPFAAFSYAADVDATQARSQRWLRCDPVVLMAGGRGLSLSQIRAADLTDDESTSLAQTVDAVLRDFDLVLKTPTRHRWYVAPAQPPKARFSPPWRVFNEGVELCMPDGDEAAQWIERMSACQIALHANPVNQRREQRALAPVSSIWFWGGSPTPDCAEPVVDQIYGDATMARGIGLYTNRYGSAFPDVLQHNHLLLCFDSFQSDSSLEAIRFMLSCWRNRALSKLTIIDPDVGAVEFSPESNRLAWISRQCRDAWSRLRKMAR